MNSKTLSRNKWLQSYVIGLALGDGNLSNPNGRATRLRITCDAKYPLLIQRILNSLETLFPNNKVSVVDRDKNYLDISVYSNHLEKILGWRAKGGSKFLQKVSVPNWIKENREYKISCLKGLIETDGSIYKDRKYPTVMFNTIIPGLASDFHEMITSLGFNPHSYEISGRKNTEYHIRLSKNVNKFLDLIKPEKD